MIKDIRSFVGRLGLGLVAAAAAPLASAAIVTGSWDPPLPQSTFPGLGWAASIVVEVDDRCIASDRSTALLSNTGFGFPFLPSSGCPGEPRLFPAFSILSAQVGIYDLMSGVINDVLDFSFTTEIQLQLAAGGQIDYLRAVLPTEPRRGIVDATEDFEFSLLLAGDEPVLLYREYQGLVNFRPFSSVGDQEFVTRFGFYEDEQVSTALNDARLVVGESIFSVPEPSALVLALLALAAASATTSHRRARAKAA